MHPTCPDVYNNNVSCQVYLHVPSTLSACVSQLGFNTLFMFMYMYHVSHLIEQYHLFHVAIETNTSKPNNSASTD